MVEAKINLRVSSSEIEVHVTQQQANEILIQQQKILCNVSRPNS